jgi:3',5'-cyclic AMP phosphodiesterase CpdA
MRIAHFSDLHVLDLDGVGAHRFLNKRATGYAMLRMNRSHVHRSAFVRAIARAITESKADHVVVTGDLTNLALETEFAAVRRIFDEDLRFSPHDVSIVPGNHDLYTRGALTSRRFTTYFGDYMTSDLPGLAVAVGPGQFPFVRLRGPAAILGLSSAVPRMPLVASGKLGKAQLHALANILRHPEVTKRTPVVLMHHPAHNPLSKVRTLLRGLEDAALFFSTLEDVPAGLLLHGHLHRRIRRTWSTKRGTMQSVGATSASLHHDDETRMAGFNVYEIEEGGTVGQVDARVFDSAKETFRVAQVPTLARHANY